MNAVAVPLAAGLGVVLLMSLGGFFRVPGLAPDRPRNVAEALALSDSATAVRMFRMGADPSAMYEVRPRMLASEVGRHARPLAAAAYTSDDHVVRTALQHKAALPPDEARAVACWLAIKEREPIALMIAPPGWSAASCGPAEERQ